MQFRICFPWKMFKYSLRKDQSKLNHRKPFLPHQFSSVQLLSHVHFLAIPWTAVPRLPCPSPTPGACSNSCPLSQWCHPTISSSVVTLSSCLQYFPDQGLFQWVSSLHQVTKGLSFSFSISPSNEYSGLISFRMDLLDLLAVQGTLKSLLQHHTSKASILRRSAFFTVQLSHPYMTTGKTIALTRRTFVGKVMSLLFNMLSRLVINFLPRSFFSFHGCSHQLQWFWSPQK